MLIIFKTITMIIIYILKFILTHNIKVAIEN